MNPILYNKNEKEFKHLGLGVLTQLSYCTVEEGRNDIFVLECGVYINDPLYAKLEKDMILVVDTSPISKKQQFRIKRIIENETGVADVYAEHVSYVTRDLSLVPEVIIKSQSARNALKIWNDSIVKRTLDYAPLEYDSDITTLNSTSWSIKDVKNAREALGGVRGSILDVWGGEYQFDNYRITLKKARGKKSSALLSYGRNITDIEQENSIMNTYTSIYPYAIQNNEDGTETLVTIDNYIVDSKYVNNYPNRRVLPIDFSEHFEYEEKIQKSKLKKLAEDYIENNDIGIPKVSINVSFVDLNKELSWINEPKEEINLCDEVHIYYEKLKINTTSKVTHVKWNVLTETYDEITIGEKRRTFSDVIKDTEETIKDIEKENDENWSMISAGGFNTIFFGPDEPTAKRVGDLWYKPVGKYTEMYIWNGQKWEYVTSDDTRKLEEEIRKMNEEINKKVDEGNKKIDDMEKWTNSELGKIDGKIEQANEKVIIRLEKYTDTQIALVPGMIDLKVEAYDKDLNGEKMVNRINISRDGVIIKGNKVSITGQTYIENAVIKSGHIKQGSIETAHIKDASITNLKVESINGNKVSGGQLSGSRVDIINLNAANIATGYLNANRIQARSITADHLAVDAVRVGINNMGNVIEMGAEYIEFYNAGIRRMRLDKDGMIIYNAGGQTSTKYDKDGIHSYYAGSKAMTIGTVSENGMNGAFFTLPIYSDFMGWRYLDSYTGTYQNILFWQRKDKDKRNSGLHTTTNLYVHPKHSLFCSRILPYRSEEIVSLDERGSLHLFNALYYGSKIVRGVFLGNQFQSSGFEIREDGELYFTYKNVRYSFSQLVSLIK